LIRASNKHELFLLEKMKFHHIGIATKNLILAKNNYINLGFTSTEIVYVPNQKVKVCFVNKKNHPKIELIEPTNPVSPVINILKKVGSTPYHICYQCSDYIETIELLKKNQFFQLSKPVISNALSNKQICFFYNKNIGLIELLEEKTDKK